MPAPEVIAIRSASGIGWAYPIWKRLDAKGRKEFFTYAAGKTEDPAQRKAFLVLARTSPKKMESLVGKNCPRYAKWKVQLLFCWDWWRAERRESKRKWRAKRRAEGLPAS